MSRLPRLRAAIVLVLLSGVLLASSLALAPTTAQAVTPSADREILWSQRCVGYERTKAPNPDCVYGDRSSHTVVVLVGDSHASHLFPAIDRIARARHWKLVVMVKVSCAFIDMRIRNRALGREYYECATWNRAVLARLTSLRPALTLVVNSRLTIDPVRGSQDTNAAKGRAVGRMLSRVPGAVSLIVDTPFRGRYTRSIPKAVAMTASLGAIERVASEYSGDPRVNLTRVICPSWPCKVVIGGITKYRDTHHLTATYSRTVGAPGGTLDRALDARLP